MCRRNGGSVDECTASMRACKEAVGEGPPPMFEKDMEMVE